MSLIDTHCHIHFDDYTLDPNTVIQQAVESGVTKILCVGCTLDDSKKGVEFVQDRSNCWATIGLHPHEAAKYAGKPNVLAEFAALASRPKVVAIGETGLDFYYNHSPKPEQIEVLEFQLDLARRHELPVIFHVREAFDEFWPIFDNFQGINGVIHSFTASASILDQILSRGLYVGLNGIMTFTKDQNQLAAARAIPLDRLVVETDAPFLTPNPFRGTICEPKHVGVIAEFLADLRNEKLEELTAATTRNAEQLFKL